MSDDTIEDDSLETTDQPTRKWGGKRVKGQFTPKEPKGQHGGYRPGGGRPAGTFQLSDGEVIKVGHTKPQGKLSKANLAISDAAEVIGIDIDPLVAMLSPVEIQLMAARMHASAAIRTSDPEDRLRKISQAASLSNRIADFFDSKMPTSTHHTIDRDPNTLSTAEIKALLMDRAHTTVPLIEGRVVEELDEDRDRSSLDHQDDDQD